MFLECKWLCHSEWVALYNELSGSEVAEYSNGKLEIAGILLTMCDARTILCKTITEQVAETFQGQICIFGSKIPNTVKVGESVYYSEPLIEYAPGSKVCRAYEQLAEEVIAYES